MLQAVLFDLDGTLLDTEPDFTFILNRMLTRYGQPGLSADLVRKLVSAGALSVVRKGFVLDEDDPRLPGYLSEFLDLYAEQIPATRASLFEDIDVLIADLNERNLSWGIMTNKSRRFSEPLLARFESFASCRTLVCPDDVGKGKPDPAGLLLACAQMGVEPARTLYIGDHPRDIEAALSAGMPGIAVGWGYLPDDIHIDKWGASFIANTPRELIDHIARHGT